MGVKKKKKFVVINNFLFFTSEFFFSVIFWATIHGEVVWLSFNTPFYTQIVSRNIFPRQIVSKL